MIKLLWIVAFIGPQGPTMVNVQETTTFADTSACETFGKDMTSRMEDWVRGRMGADWGQAVGVQYHCAPAGQPA